MLHGEEGGFGICLEVPASTWLKGSQEISSLWIQLMRTHAVNVHPA